MTEGRAMASPSENSCHKQHQCVKHMRLNFKRALILLFLAELVCAQIEGIPDSLDLLCCNDDLSPQEPQKLFEDPHTCFGNIQHCSNGFSLTFSLLAENPSSVSEPRYIVSSGGQSAHANGFFIREQHGEYEAGVSLGNKFWTGKTGVVNGSLFNVALTWRKDIGLTLYVDGFTAGLDSAGNTRLHIAPDIQAMSNIWLGKANDDFSSSDVSYRVRVNNMTITEAVLSQDDVARIAEETPEIYFVGCTANTPSDLNAIDEEDIVDTNGCRKACVNRQFEMAIFHPQLSTCGCLLYKSYSEQKDDLDLQVDTCDVIDGYHIVFATHAIFNGACMHDIAMSVTPSYPSPSGQLRPLETLPIVISYNNKLYEEPVFIFEFNDGSISEILYGPIVGHAYTMPGDYSLNVTAETAHSRESVTTVITVVDVTEDFPPQTLFLQTRSNEETESLAVTVEAYVFSELQTTCVVSLGDGSDDVTFQNNVQSEQFLAEFTTDYVYEKIGIYEVSIDCSNDQSSLVTEEKAVPVDPNTILEDIDDDIDIQHSGLTPNEVVVLLNDETLSSGWTVSNDALTITHNMLKIGENVLRLEVLGATIFQRIYRNLREFSEVEIIPDKTFTEINNEVRFEFKISGDNAHFELSFGDGYSEIFFKPNGYGLSASGQKTHSYVQPEDYTVDLVAANDVDYKADAVTVEVERRINDDITMTISNPDRLDQLMNFVFRSDNPLPQLHANFMFSDGYKVSDMVLGQRSGNSNELQANLQLHHYGKLSVEVQVFNRLGSKTMSTKFQKGDALNHVYAYVENNHVEVDSDVEITITIPNGWPIAIEADMGDNKAPVIIKRPVDYNPDTDCWITADEETGDDGSGDDDDGSGSDTGLTGIRDRRSIDSSQYSGDLDDFEEEDVFVKDFRLPNEDIVLRYSYENPGQYTVTIVVENCFNSVNTTLCPKIVVVSRERPQVTCEDLSVELEEPTVETYEIYRADSFQIGTAKYILCSTDQGYTIEPVFTWEAERLNEDGEWIPSPDLCSTQTNDKGTLNVAGNTFSYGTYKVSVSVSPGLIESRRKREVSNEDFDILNTVLKSNKSSTYFTVIPSPLVADIQGQCVDGISYHNASESVEIDISQSRDRDVLKPTNRTGFMAYLFCFRGDIYDEMANLSLADLQGRSHQVKENLNKNLKIYDHSGAHNCFKDNSRFTAMDFTFSFNKYVEDETLTFLLIVTKDTPYPMREARSHMSCQYSTNDGTDIGDALDKLTEEEMAKNPGKALQQCGNIAERLDEDGGEKSEDVKKQVTKFFGKMEYLCKVTKTTDQVAEATSIISKVTEKKGLVNVDGQVKAAGGLNNAAKKASNLSEESSRTQVEAVFGNITQGVTNILPKDDQEQAQQDEARRRRRRRAIDDEEDESDLELTCCDRYHGLCEWIQPETPGVRFPKTTVWTEEDCNCKHPADIKKVLVKYDEMLAEKARILREKNLETAGGGVEACSTIVGVLGEKQNEGENITAGNSDSFMISAIKLDKDTIKGAKARRKKRDLGEDTLGCKWISETCVPYTQLEKMTEKTTIMDVKSDNMFGDSNPAASGKSKLTTFEVTDKSGVTDIRDITDPFIFKIPNPDSNVKFTENSVQGNSWAYYPVNGSDLMPAAFFTLYPEDDADVYQWCTSNIAFPNETFHDACGEIPKPYIVTNARRELHKIQNETEEMELKHYMERTVVIPLDNNATTYIGVRVKKSQLNIEGDNSKNFTQKTLILTPICKYWNKELQIWDNAGLNLSSESNPNYTLCESTHLSSFGSDMVVPPNTIDFSTVFSMEKFVESLPVFFTVVLTLLIYIIILIWARHMDKKDIIKWGSTPLEDNLPSDNYHYQLSVYTGLKKSAGTTSKVSFILSGDGADTGVRRLNDGKRKEFPKGSIYNFILSVENGLGPLTYLRIWHDNSGSGKKKGWFLDQVMVTDLQTGEKFVFLLSRWLAVEEDDGMVERIIPVASMSDLSAFRQLFSSSVRKKLSNDHLWFSVVSRPTRSSFTRAQRVSCCVALLYLTMITNCMFFKAETQSGQVSAITLGPFSFTLAQLFVSIATTCIVFPPSLAIVTIFRKARPKNNKIQQEHQQQSKKSNKYKWRTLSQGSALWGKVEKSRFQKMQESVRNILTYHRRSKYQVDDPDDSKKKKKKTLKFPHWTIYIAWTLVALSILASGFFTILYSMEWGRKKSVEWLTTFLLSFFQSVIVVQPIKVLLLAAFISCIVRKPELEDEEEGDDNAVPRNDEELLSNSQRDLQELMRQRRLAASEVAPPDMETLQKARDLRMKEMQIEAILKECLSYFFFVLVLFFLSYQTRDSDSFLFAENIKNTFERNSPLFSSISKPYQAWPWLRNTLLPNMYAGPWHESRPHCWREALQIDDRSTIRVGVARLRQLRVKDDTCDVFDQFESIIGHCRDSYNWVDDDAGDYTAGWHPVPGNETDDPYGDSPWVYRSSVELKNAPYPGLLTVYKGGGYTFNFHLNLNHTQILLDELEMYSWLDPRTRALFVEFTLYNANVNLFASVVMVLEFMSSGGALSKTEVKVFRLSSYVGGFGIIVVLFELLYLGFTLFFFVKMCRALHKKKLKYFKDFWDLLEFSTLVMSIVVIVMYAMKKVFGTVAMNALHDSGSGDYVNFVTIALWDSMFGYMMAIVVFLATVKLIKMLKFNRRMSMLGDTIKLASKDLKHFSAMFFIYFMAFASMGYLLFGKIVSLYGSFGGTIEALFAFALGDFDFYELKSANSLGPFFFFMYVFIMNIGLMGMFLTIINDAFVQVKADSDMQSNDYEIVDFIVEKLKGTFGCGN